MTNNTVELGRWDVDMTLNIDELNWDDASRAIFSTDCYGFTMQGNTISPSNLADPAVDKEGIVVGYVRDHNDVVFNNTATGMERGFVGEGISADILGQGNMIGLQFQCNDNTGNATNLLSRRANGALPNELPFHTIRGTQGSTLLAAGNGFDQASNGFDFEMTTTQIPLITYYYDPTQADGQPQYFTSFPGVSEILPEAITGTDNACVSGPAVQPGGGTLGTLTATLESSKLEYGNIRYIYDQLIDGGSADNVVQEITSTWSAEMWALRSSLLEKSPYLSAGVLKELVDEGDVPLAIKAEVLIANPDATQSPGFLNWAQEDAAYPLPAYIAASIVASWRTPTYRGTLEGQMADKHTAMSQAANGLIHLFHQDTVAPTTDTLLWVWRQLPTPAARFAEAALLLSQGDMNSAFTLVEALPDDERLPALALAERTNMLTYIGVLRDAANDDRDAYHLNTPERIALSTLVADNYDRPSGWAANLLCVAYGNCRPPNTGGGRTERSLVVYGLQAPVVQAAPSFTLQPNPASTWCAVSFQGLTEEAVAEVYLEDASGRLVQRIRARGAQGQVVLDTQALAPGVYTVRMTENRVPLSAQRLVVQP